MHNLVVQSEPRYTMKTPFRFDGRSGRWTIGEHELHCGDCFQLQAAGKWHDVRIELTGADGWYLVGLHNDWAMNYNGYPARRYA